MAENLPYSRAATLPERFFSDSITITGAAATGTSTVAKQLREKLDPRYRFVSGGEIMRARAQELGLTIEAFTRSIRNNPEGNHDRQCDQIIADCGQRNFLLTEARLGYVFVPPAYNVQLVCPFDICVKRRHADLSKNQPGLTAEQVAQDIKERDDCDQRRYEQLYPGCLWSEGDFNLTIDTGTTSIEEAVRRIIEGHQFWLKMKGDRIVTSDRLPL